MRCELGKGIISSGTGTRRFEGKLFVNKHNLFTIRTDICREVGGKNNQKLNILERKDSRDRLYMGKKSETDAFGLQFPDLLGREATLLPVSPIYVCH